MTFRSKIFKKFIPISILLLSVSFACAFSPSTQIDTYGFGGEFLNNTFNLFSEINEKIFIATKHLSPRFDLSEIFISISNSKEIKEFVNNSNLTEKFNSSLEALAGVAIDTSNFWANINDNVFSFLEPLKRQTLSVLGQSEILSDLSKINKKINLAQTTEAVGGIFNRTTTYIGSKINNFIGRITSNAPIVFDGYADEGIVSDDEALIQEKEKFNFIRNDSAGVIESGYSKAQVQVETQATAIKPVTQNIVQPIERVIERTVSFDQVTKPIVSSLGFYTQAEVDALLKNYNESLRSELLSRINNLSSISSNQYAANTTAIALTNKIDQMNGTSLSNITVSGVSGLTDSDIPDGITVSGYLALAGGNLTGNLGIGTTSPYAPLSVEGQAVASYFTTSSTTATSTFAYGIDLLGGCFSIDGVCVTGGGGAADGNWSTTSAEYFVNSSTTIPKTYTDNIFSGLNIFGNASTSQLSVSGNSYLNTIISGVWNGTVIDELYGGTGQTSFVAGDILYANAANTLSKLPHGGEGTVLKVSAGLPTWSVDLVGAGGGSGVSPWATSSDNLSIYPVDTGDVVIVGASATTSDNTIFEVTGNSKFTGDMLITGSTTLQNFSGVNASTSLLSVTGSAWLGTITGPLQAVNGLVSATSTMSVAYGGTGLSSLPTYGQLLLGNSSGGYTLTSTSSLGIEAFSTTSVNYWYSSADRFSTTSTNYLLGTFDKGYFFSTTSSDFWYSSADRFSTTSTNYWYTVQDKFSSTSADYWYTTKSDMNWSTTSTNYWMTQNNFFSTTSSDYWYSSADRFSTTSTNYWMTQNNFFSTTSSDYWYSSADRFSTTSTNYLLGTFDKGYFFSTTSADYYTNSSTTIPKTYTANNFTALNTFTNASTTLFSVSGSSWLGTIISGVWNGTVIDEIYGGTGQSSYTQGDILYASSANTLSKLAHGGDGTVLKISGGLPVWGTDLVGAGGSGVSPWATSSDNLSIYPVDTGDVVIVGASATTSDNTIFEVTGNSKFTGDMLITGSTTLQNFSGVNASTSLFSVTGSAWIGTITGPLQAVNGLVSATSTMSVAYGGTGLSSLPSYGQLLLGNSSGGYTLTSTSSLGIEAFSTTSANYLLGTIDKGYFFSTTSSDYWYSSADRFSTTSTNYLLGTVDKGYFFSTTSADYYTNSSTTIPKTYTANNFTALNTFTNASTTQFSITGSAWLGTISGPLQAVNGLVSATSTMSVAYGGTGLSSLPAYGQLLLGNSSGGYTLTSTSSLNIVGAADGNWSTTSAEYFVHSSTTIPKTYTANTFTGLNVFGNSSSTLLSVSGNTWLNTFTGPLQAVNGLVSATSTMSVAYGGTGLSSLPSYGQLLLGNSLGGYTLTSTSSLGFSLPWTINGNNIYNNNSGNVGIGTTSPYAKLSVVGEIVGSYFSATSTSATSTFTNFVTTGNASSSNIRISNGFYQDGLINCIDSKEVIKYNSSTGKFYCSVERDEMRSFTEMIPTTYVDSNGTEYWDGTQPNITPTSNTSEILVIATINHLAVSNTDYQLAVTMTRDSITGDGVAVCTDPQAYAIGWPATFGNSTSSVTVAFVDSPATTTKVAYTICSSAAGENAGGTISRMDITLFEINNNTADLAEVYPTNDILAGPGDLVMIDPELNNGVKKSSGAYNNDLVGVISTKPALLIGYKGGEGLSGLPVALSGRVPVKVNTENGSIRPGDYLTSSSVPGVAMKATKAGKVIGQAMSGFDNDGIGFVVMFINNGTYNGKSLRSLIEDDSDNFGKLLLAKLIDNSSNIISSSTVSELYTDRIAAGLEIVTPKATIGGLTVDSIGSVSEVVKFLGDVDFFGRPYFNSDTGGFAVIKAGARKVRVDFEREFINEPIINTSLSTEESYDSASVESLFLGDLKYVITNRNSKGFTIVINRDSNFDIKFSWIALAIKNSKTFSSKTDDIISSDYSEQSASINSSIDGDNVPPVIILNGNNPARLSIGAMYSDPGAIINDNKDQNLGYHVSTYNGEILISENEAIVDTKDDGVYDIKYNAVDSAGNRALEVIRRVIVGEGEQNNDLDILDKDNNIESNFVSSTPEVSQSLLEEVDLEQINDADPEEFLLE